MAHSSPRSSLTPDGARDRLVTVPEAADLLRLSTRKINNLLAAGNLRRIKIGRATRIQLSELETVIREGAA